MSAHATLFRSFGLAASLAAGLTAQSLDGQVTRDPNAGVVMYDFQFNGPPGGSCYLFVSTSLLTPPLQLPPFGSLYLDPLSLFALTPLPLTLDPLGRGGFQLPIPPAVTLDLSLSFQSVVLHQGNAQISPTFLSLVQGGSVLAPQAPGYTFSYSSAQPVVRAQFTGQPGSQTTIQVQDAQGGMLGSATVPIGPNGTAPGTPVPLSGPIQRGATYTVTNREPNGNTRVVGRGTY